MNGSQSQLVSTAVGGTVPLALPVTGADPQVYKGDRRPIACGATLADETNGVSSPIDALSILWVAAQFCSVRSRPIDRMNWKQLPFTLLERRAPLRHIHSTATATQRRRDLAVMRKFHAHDTRSRIQLFLRWVGLSSGAMRGGSAATVAIIKGF
ncbi:hypothetical protein GGX14DRAFT_403490 [Mycena pura]|uniref:Uncharacterized protein n=1 Tax=Mycena pura TaxID=153505 RepID=A0AAD6Y6D0_9AGAR|nr:hypothetical protein GGX14DRAFT_403490 [Mycena pura]